MIMEDVESTSTTATTSDSASTSDSESTSTSVSTSESVSESTSTSTSDSTSESESEPVHLTDQEIYDLNHPKTYMAKAGESLLDICNHFHVSYGLVCDINHFRNAKRPYTNRPYEPPMLLKLRK